ncbi:MAG: hypothetical protein KHZ58_10775 [Hungatella hathewayi]|nr:hypothetical protein [Hungatella hathewayi]
MRKNFLKVAAVVAAMVVMMAMPAYAGEWKQDTTGWWYENSDGTYLTNQWEWIDGKCYYFGADGYMLTNGTAPDGSTVNEKGEWTVNGAVQAKNNGSGNTGSAANDQYPLKDVLWDWFGNDAELGGKTTWKWHDWYIPWDLNEEVKAVGAYQYVLNCAIRDKNPRYLSSWGDLNLAVLAELSGYPQTGLEHVDQNKKAKMVQEVRNFLNSFDWRNASDYEKAVRITNWIMKAEYDYNESEDCHYPYGCLVNKSAMCDGYTSAAELLGTCIGLPVNGMGSISHAYPVFLVDGVWLAHEPTSKDKFFTIADVYEISYFLNGVDYLFEIGNYCKGVGYIVPTDVSNKFPDVRMGWAKGKAAQIIYFK